ncbi:GntR family transcriptional regulator [Streptomyces sp. NPDC101118]|uniref:GntR family transcriptional regulator n=1 Tax=Streptomyces sp. NPDC101118 TaxID=3366109 RepID=UPI00382043CE
MPPISRRQVIADDLRNQISSGHIEAGERLPSEAQLASRYGVSTPTLRNALADLQTEGLVEKIHGKGNFVRHRLRRLTYVGGGILTQASPTTEPLHVTVRTNHLRAQGPLTDLLKVSADSPVTEFRCLSHEGRSPHSLACIYVPSDLAPANVPSESPWSEGVEAHLSAHRPPSTEIQETLTARHPTPEEAATLRISSALAVLAIKRVAADSNGRVIEAALLVLPGDRADATFTSNPTTSERRAEG